MIRYLSMIMLVALLVPSLVHGVSLTCDTYPTTGVQPDNFLVRVGTQVYDSTPLLQGDGSVVLMQYLNDIVPVGTTEGGVTACKTYEATEWYEGGPRCSSETPFTFVRPADPTAPGSPTGVRIVSGNDGGERTANSISQNRGSSKRMGNPPYAGKDWSPRSLHLKD